MAWLNSSPKMPEKSKAKKKRRFETLKDGHHSKQLPIANEHLTNCFNAIGRVSSNGMGFIPVSWAEIESFSNRSSYFIDDWEADILHEMSCEYCSMLAKADGEACPAPYGLDITNDAKAIQEMHDRVDAQLDKLFA